MQKEVDWLGREKEKADKRRSNNVGTNVVGSIVGTVVG